MSGILTMPFALRLVGLPALLGILAVLATGPLANSAAAQEGEPTCDDEGAYGAEGSLLNRDSIPADATAVHALRYGVHPNCERLVLDFANADGAAAQVLGQANVAFHRHLGIVRVHLPLEFAQTALPDEAIQLYPEGNHVRAAYTVFSEDDARGPFVDIHVAEPVVARAFVLESPARLVVDIRPGGGPLGEGAHGGVDDNIVVVTPGEQVQLDYPIDITGYSRTFEANVVARLYQDGAMVAESITTASSWLESWGEFSTAIDAGPTGSFELFVGTDSAMDGSEEGIRLIVTIGDDDAGETPPPGAQTYVIAPGDTLSGIALAFGVPVQALVAVNNIDDPNLIIAGEELVIPGVGGQDPTQELMAVVEQYVVDTAGQTYAGNCDTTTVEEDAGSYCSAVVSETAEQAVVDIGPAFSEFTERLTFGLVEGGWVLSNVDEVPGEGTGTPYVIQPGDTLSAIAVAHDTTVAALVEANGIDDPNMIIAGEMLEIPFS